MTYKSDRVFSKDFRKIWFMARAFINKFFVVSVVLVMSLLSGVLLTGCALEASFVGLSLSSETPMKLALLSPPTSPSTESKPTLRMNGLKKNTLVTLYSDSTCANKLVSAVATNSSLDITLPELAEGENPIYVKVSEAGGSSSGFSSKIESPCFYGDITYTYENFVWQQQAFLKTSNADSGDLLGLSPIGLEDGISIVVIDGDTVAVASTMESSSQTTITNGSLASENNDFGNSGAVYIFKRSGVNWIQEAYIKPKISHESYIFGSGLDLNGDTLAVSSVVDATTNTSITNGDDIVLDSSVSERSSGAVFIYKRSGDQWKHQAYIKPANKVFSEGIDFLGFGISMSLDGNTLAVGAFGDSSTQNTITNGSVISVVNDDSKSASGAVYIYTRLGNVWSQEAYIKSSNADREDYFGLNISLSGDRLAVAARGEDSSLKTINNSGISGTDNNLQESGAVYIFKRSGANWSQEAYIKAINSRQNMYFGWSVSISGNTLAVGVPCEGSLQQSITNGEAADSDNSLPMRGAVYVYRLNGGQWSQEAYIKPSNLYSMLFGRNVSLDGDILSVGSAADMYNYSGVQNGSGNNGISQEDIDSDANTYYKEESGAVYLYRRTNNKWSQTAYIKELIPKQYGLYAIAASVSKNTLAVVAPMDSSSLRSIINGAGGGVDEGSPGSGAVYVYSSTEAIASINKGTPEKISSSNNFVMQIGGSDIVAYRYKAGPAGTTNCSDVTGYSDTASVSTALNLNLSAYANGEMVLCLLGETSGGKKQSVINASSYRWTKDSSAPISQ